MWADTNREIWVGSSDTNELVISQTSGAHYNRALTGVHNDDTGSLPQLLEPVPSHLKVVDTLLHNPRT